MAVRRVKSGLTSFHKGGVNSLSKKAKLASLRQREDSNHIKAQRPDKP